MLFSLSVVLIRVTTALNINPYESPSDPQSSKRLPASAEPKNEVHADPVLAYTAEGNLEAHTIVAWLESNGVHAYAVEDNSGVSLFAFGTISQFHQPQIFVDRPDSDRAAELLQQYEQQRERPQKDDDGAEPIDSECEECGTTSEFPASQDGTTQNCPKCDAFIDVGAIDWPEDCDFGDGETDASTLDNDHSQ